MNPQLVTELLWLVKAIEPNNPAVEVFELVDGIYAFARLKNNYVIIISNKPEVLHDRIPDYQFSKQNGSEYRIFILPGEVTTSDKAMECARGYFSGPIVWREHPVLIEADTAEGDP